MVQTHHPEFHWGTISEKNSGHTQDEWGATKTSKTKKIIAYTVSWNR